MIFPTMGGPYLLFSASSELKTFSSFRVLKEISMG